MNQINIDDIYMWVGELAINNKLLQKEINKLVSKLEQIESQLKENGDVYGDIPIKQKEGKNEEKLGKINNSVSD